MDKKILIIIPAYNEEQNIVSVYNSIMKYNNKNKAKYNVIVINDGSTDKTAELCLENDIPCINLLHNLGIGGAVQTGYKYAFKHGYDIAIQFDGDGQHDVNYVKKIIQPILDNRADLVIGSRFIKNEESKFQSTKSRRIGIQIISNLINMLSKSNNKITDPTSGFRAINKKIISLFANHYPVEYPEPESLMLILKSNYKVIETPVEMKERSGGKSSIYNWISIYYMFNVCLAIFLTGIKGSD